MRKDCSSCFEANSSRLIDWSWTGWRFQTLKLTDRRTTRSQNEPHENIYADDLLLVSNEHLARADFNGKFRLSSSALLHRSIYNILSTSILRTVHTHAHRYRYIGFFSSLAPISCSIMRMFKSVCTVVPVPTIITVRTNRNNIPTSVVTTSYYIAYSTT